MKSIVQVITLFIILLNSCSAKTVEYDLVIDYKRVEFNNKTTIAMAVNGLVPAPTLYFQQGDIAQINVSNQMNVETSVHWHGLLIPNHQDGVPYVNHPPIEPGAAHLFKFELKHPGTYWYHSHTGLQEQRGVYGAIVIYPTIKPAPYFDQQTTVVLSDWINEDPDEVLRTLKSGSDFYSIKKGSQQNVLSAIQQGGLKHFFKQSLNRMSGMDISDVAYDAFLANGQTETIIPAKVGDVVKLRLVNAATATYFNLQFAKGDIQIIAADGNDVLPLNTNNFLMAIAETYTLLITVPEPGLFELRASAQDGSGYSSIWIGSGERVVAPDIKNPDPYTMNMSEHKMAHGMKHNISNDMNGQTPYKKLKALSATTLPIDNKTREIQLDLTGDMRRYVWSINNEILSADNVIKISRGENLRFVLNNKTMMHHPMHLHGHFFRVLNDQGAYSPLKHTVDVPPMGQQIIEFEGNEKQDWFFHCHILYHAKAGMARVISYKDDLIDAELVDIRHKLYSDKGFFYTNGALLSQMTEGEAVLTNSKNTLHTDWQIGWQNVPSTEYEVNISYERTFSRFFSGFAGVSLEDDTARGIFGFKYLFPLKFETEWRVDTLGDLRITLANDIQLTQRINLFADYEYDTESQEEWQLGIEYSISKNLGFVTQFHSDFGVGAGFKLAY
ncbi:MAG: multicopper oxidase domain-containing protein [Methylococcales symbiont of Hymedesmia sp. n. MRB-2018]|nr:MAG: multicopper oxidase domain-containing protein [Methylococcales symbiont of Hymedesmia sp. n. MRB-2018]